MLTRIHASIKRHCTVSRSAKFGVPPPLSAAAMRRTSRHRVQSPKADMQNGCCRRFTNPHKLPCKPVCNLNTNAADMGQCWATGSQQFPGGAGLRRHQKKHAASASLTHPSAGSMYILDVIMTCVMLARIHSASEGFLRADNSSDQRLLPITMTASFTQTR